MNGVKRAVFLVLIGVVFALLCMFLVTRRGFRAADPPSAFETTVARKLRNIAIPTRNREEKNPLIADSAALSDARELFVSRCAVCPGLDGSGKTQIGLNLYPRVPDLRASRTQHLSDGELHFIIENGVQSTAWALAQLKGWSNVSPWRVE